MTEGAVTITAQYVVLRELTLEDVTPRYLAWLRDDDTQRFISAAATTQALDDLRHYVRERAGRDDVLFLGIFDRVSGVHIGNVKFEPVNTSQGYAIMGILIGESESRGKGITTDVLNATSTWLKQHRGIRQVILGVSRDNPAAIRAYEKAGFVEAATPHLPMSGNEHLTMVREL